MGFLFCNAESAIATCDPYNWDRGRQTRRRATKLTNKPPKIRDFTYAELVTATDGFSAESFLGKGSHGTVYKAVLDNGRLTAAVKRATCTADNEIEILSRVHHPRLVNLIGFCSDPKHRKLLVVEYMPNGSLYDLLHSRLDRPPGWTRRVRFALQIARAVHALHSSNPPVIHRDVKSSNVLIDGDGNARLGDFGLALRGHVEDVRVQCTPPAGTLGYLDPGYLAPGDVSAKNDVFSFGILLLEIISGRNAIDVNFSPPSVVDWALPLIRRGDHGAICDRRLGPPADPAVIRGLAAMAARCVRSAAEKRPGMGEVVEGLKAVSRRASAPNIWNQLRRRRVGRVEGSRPSDDVGDRSEEEAVNVVIPKTVRVGSRRNRKVSSVSSVEYGIDGIDSGAEERAFRSKSIDSEAERVLRSKSIGSISEMNKMVGSDYYRKRGVTVKMAAVKLSKSKSVGVLHGQRLLHYNNKNNFRGGLVFDYGVDEKSQRRIQEQPLVSM